MLRMLLCFLLLASPLFALAQNAVDFRGTRFVALDAMLAPEFLNGSDELVYWGRNIVIDLPDRRIIVENGGDQLRDADGRVGQLDAPVLVLGEDWYVPAAEFAGPAGFTAEGNPPEVLRNGGRELVLDAEPLLANYPWQQIETVRAERRSLRVMSPLRAFIRLAPEPRTVEIPAGSLLLQRRTFLRDGEPWLLLTRNDESLMSFIAPAAEIDAATSEADFAGSYLEGVFSALESLAEDGLAVRHGSRAELPETVALTSDLCWSLRPYEEPLYDYLSERAAGGEDVAVTQFVSGRWMEQYPQATAELLAREADPRFRQTWALHSWAHPKSGIFMNAWAPESLRGDTLLTEKLLLEWGIVPAIYYRFPGLTHDETRLRGILALDLISVDCDSWVSSMHTRRNIYRHPATDGSILLVHGNGNERRGIERFLEWIGERPDWRLESLEKFIDPETIRMERFTGNGEAVAPAGEW